MERAQVFCIVVALSLAAIFIASVDYWQTARNVGAPIEATVMGLANRQSSGGFLPVVTVRFDNGQQQQLVASYSSLKNCRLGSRILLVPTPSGSKVAYAGCPNNLP